MQTKTDCTVVAVFDDAESARAAAAELKSAGFTPDRIYLSCEAPAGLTHDAGTGPHTTSASSLKHWFKSLFGSEEHIHRRGYESAIAGGKSIVSVDVEEGLVDKASEILNRHSPIDAHTEDYGAAKGISTSNTNNAGYQGSRSDFLNARDELAADAQTGAVRVYPRPSAKP